MQINIFELTRPKYKITKPIRLIELFAGIGSQAKALKNIGANFEHYKIVEFDKYAIASYNAIHNTNFAPLDITKITAKDLGIVETDKYDYIMTYSFPCQDLSIAGKRKGMKKGDNTRSGLLWEVERILEECCGYKEHRVPPRNSKYLSMVDWVDDYNFDIDKNKLPQILLMENVPEVIGSNNIQDFNLWQKKLESLGYSNYIELLNAKDYEMPQNRNRCFMISILGDYYYQFPRKQKLKYRLKDFLEDEVDEKYYLSEKMIKGMQETKFESYKLENKLLDINGNANTIIARFEGAPQCVIVPEATKKGYAIAHVGDGIYINRPHQKRGVVQKGMIQTLKTSGDDVGVVVGSTQKNAAKNYDGVCPTLTSAMGSGGGHVPFHNYEKLRIRKLTPKECWRLMGFSDDDFEKASKVNSNTQLYKQAGNAIVVNVLEAIFKKLF